MLGVMQKSDSRQPRKLRPRGPSSPAVETAPEGTELSEMFGDEVRQLRKARDMKLAELSEKTGLSVGYLSQVERGISSPSIKALHSISRALGVTISWFFSDAGSAKISERRFIVRADRRRSLRFEGGITDELLSPNLSGALELLRCTFEPGASSGDEPYTHRGEEAGIIVSGSLELWLGDEHFVLREGDSFTFPSDRPHKYKNTGDTRAIVIWAITPPSY